MNRWFVPIVSHDIRIHRSYTRKDVVGTIYLSEAPDHVQLAEAIIHEFYHGVLNCVMATHPVFEQTNPDEKFYSPWRDDPRPLNGLLHAVYVFSGVAEYYALASSTLAGTVHEETVRLRCSKLYYQLRYALAQLPMDKLSPLGRKIFGEIASKLTNDSYATAFFDPGVAEVVEGHFRDWCDRNPQLPVEVPVGS